MIRETIFVGLLMLALPAHASVSVALSIDEIAKPSLLVARVVPLEQTSAWEDGRIVSTTRLRVDRLIAGQSEGELRVRTLGGRIGDVGQIVEGEAQFAPGTPSIVFLSRWKDRFVVTGRAQGQLVVARAFEGREIVRLPVTGMLVDRERSAQLVKSLAGREVAEVTREVVAAWERTHAH